MSGGRGLEREEEEDTLVRMQKQENKKSLKKEFDCVIRGK